MTNSLSELEKQLAGYEQMLHERSCEKLEAQVECCRLKSQLAAVEKDLQEYKEALEFIFDNVQFNYSKNANGESTVFIIMPEIRQIPSWKYISINKNPLAAIQAARKSMERKGE